MSTTEVGKPIIVYYRVSTDHQADLFLNKQKEAMTQYLNGAVPVAEYMDLGSSSGSGQPQLLYAVEHAYKINGLLVVTTRNRLSRHEDFFTSLKERGIGYICINEVEKDI